MVRAGVQAVGPDVMCSADFMILRERERADHETVTPATSSATVQRKLTAKACLLLCVNLCCLIIKHLM